MQLMKGRLLPLKSVLKSPVASLTRCFRSLVSSSSWFRYSGTRCTGRPTRHGHEHGRHTALSCYVNLVSKCERDESQWNEYSESASDVEVSSLQFHIDASTLVRRL